MGRKINQTKYDHINFIYIMEPITACCCTYLRPEFLGQLIWCWKQQTYPANRCELIILDDAGQYDNCCGTNWRLISTNQRYPTLSLKKNALIRMASSDIVCVADDDDYYFPHWMETVAATLHQNLWLRPSQILNCLLQRFRSHPRDKPNEKWFHGGWAYRQSAFWEVGGYTPELNSAGDIDLAQKLLARFGESTDSIQFNPKPYYLFREGPWDHISAIEYDDMATPSPPKTELIIQELPPFYSQMEFPDQVQDLEDHPYWTAQQKTQPAPGAG